MTTLRDIQKGAESALQSARDHLEDLQEENETHAFVDDQELEDIIEAVKDTLVSVGKLTIPDEPEEG